MAKRSLQASPAGIKKAKQHFANKGWTQEYLASEVGIKTRQPIWRFFAGQAIERYTFFEICTRLDLDWREIAFNPPLDYIDPEDDQQNREEFANMGIDALVQMVRAKRRGKITHQCGILQLLDISRPVTIDQIYVDVNILEEIASQQWMEIAAINSLPPQDIDRFGLGKIVERQISSAQAIAKYSKLRVLGKPGSGKTTFLKHLAIECNREEIKDSQVPIFIKLRDLSQSYQENQQINLLEFIQQEFLSSEITHSSILKKLLQAGRVLLMMDGMDEVSSEIENVVLNEIRRFTEKYHKNQFVATCRTASQKLALQGFTDVEIAPFTQEQISSFAHKWFIAFSSSGKEDGAANSLVFLEKLELPENWCFRRMITTPLFLHLACSVFHRQDRFPIKKAEFYKQGMDLLLGKWDEARGIERDQMYRGFQLPQKLKLLSQIAASTFEQGQFFFEQNVIEQYIGDYLESLPEASKEPDEIQLASEGVLKAIESQHGLLAERARGIFSFSYLALQEYFTARKIVANHNLQSLGQSLQGLVDHITDPHWREIFLLTAGMLRSADGLVELMKQQIDGLVSEDPYLQEFLAWASQKSDANSPETKSATGRAFYLALNRAPDLAPDLALVCTLDQGEFLDAALDELLRECIMKSSKDFAYVHACSEALGNILGVVLDLGFHKSLQQLQDQLPNSHYTKEGFDNWCKQNYDSWVKQLQIVIADHRNISNKWQFNTAQDQILQRYYDANQLLLDCLNSNCEVTPNIREQIEETLLLPQLEIEKREWE
ncbi:NACHT domain-containing NTPase [Pseudanabaena sp. FACHB-1998]|uniref:NACHT domain-containing protein n=1 Tax=Pseudanabaena sp. FACHB-1998 TaxID=2692858 RepID=UPI0016815568|nr:NACHT domain-containing NTPase [Pseudanabaena sp. FACHB-1998]MBD2178654.1 NACHT domain-containing NTPase [Pseudanabaena sp. FACHB-1998]